MENLKKRLIVIDSNSIIHRAYHALPKLTTKEGNMVNAVYGFLLVFFRAIKEFQPDFVAAAFDFPGPTFRHKKYKEYKAKRPRAPEELYLQIPKVKEILSVFNVPVFEKEGFEADDIIGTIAALSPQNQAFPEIETIILSGDLDNLQLINPQTKVYVLRKGVKDIVLYDEKMVEEKFQGLSSAQLLDFKALRGDPSDNIPGVTGVGEKTAIDLVLKFENLESLYKELEESSENAKKLGPRLKEVLLKYKEQAFLSRDLAEIKKDVPIMFDMEKCKFGEYNKEKAVKALEDYEFYSLTNRLPEIKEAVSEKKETSFSKNQAGADEGSLKLW